jgi:transcriptional regulator with XRE-family HTH domain
LVPRSTITSLRSPGYGLLVEVLREAREFAGLRHDELSKRLGRDRMYVYSIEHRSRRVDPEEVREIAQALGVEPAEIFNRWLTRVERSADT